MYEFIICFIAGIGAGLGTGFAGMSAAAVISPMLIAFLGIEAYEAVGIALASDVLASAASAYTYGKNKNLDVRNGIVMMMSVLAFTLAGSFFGKPSPKYGDGRFFCFYDVSAWGEISCKTCNDDERNDECRKRQNTHRAVSLAWRHGRFYLWIYWRGWGNDDAIGIDKRFGV